MRIVIVDDDAEVRARLRLIVSSETDMDVVGEASDGHQALRMVQTLRPLIVLMDISMPGWSGLTTTRMILRACPSVRVIAVSGHQDPSVVQAMLDAGAAGYLLKQNAFQELTDVIRSVAAGATHIE